MAERVFIPYRLDGLDLVFEYRRAPQDNRRRFVAVARCEDGRYRPTGNAPLSPDERRRLQASSWPDIPEDGLRLDLASDADISGILGAFASGIGFRPVELVALYLELAKQVAVAASTSSDFLAAGPLTAADVPRGAALLRELTGLCWYNRARAVAELLRPLVEAAKAPDREAAFLAGSLATLGRHLEDRPGEVAMRLAAVSLAPSARTHLALATAHFHAGSMPEAIEAYMASDALDPLPAMAARRLVSLMVSTGQAARGAQWVETRRSRDTGDAEALGELLGKDG